MKTKMTDIRGLTGPDYITLKLSRKQIEKFPKCFYIDLDIIEVRDASPTGRNYPRKGKRR